MDYSVSPSKARLLSIWTLLYKDSFLKIYIAVKFECYEFIPFMLILSYFIFYFCNPTQHCFFVCFRQLSLKWSKRVSFMYTFCLSISIDLHLYRSRMQSNIRFLFPKELHLARCVAHNQNPNCLEGWGRKISSSRPAWAT